MTRLMKFLSLTGLILTIWIAIIGQFYVGKNDLISVYFILPLPLHLIIMFGLYSAFIVLHRTFNFNNCPEAAQELNTQIKEARADLAKKGFKFCPEEQS